jgi:acetoin utilization deacetylase AcuC-like enzyme
VNPRGNEKSYVENFEQHLDFIGEKIKQGEVHYVVFAHGADSHIDDDLGGYCNTTNWLKCAELFAEWVCAISQEIGKPLPVTLTLFGGYRKNNYDAVLDLHIQSLKTCWEIIGMRKEGSVAA